MKIALLYNQKPDPDRTFAATPDAYCEWDAPETIQAVSRALRERHEVVELDCHPDRVLEWTSVLQRERPDLCFNMAEGAGALSREAQIPALLDLLGLRYTASDALTLATSLDKARTKEILTFHHIPTPGFQICHTPADLDGDAASTLAFPLIVKPLHEGSSKGIYERSLVTSRAALACQVNEVLHQYQQSALVEEFLPGREFTVALLGNGAAVEVLPIVEIMFDHLPAGAKPLYSYEAKWVWDDPARPIDLLHCPADVSARLRAEIEDVCRRAYHALRCRDWARIDVRLDAAGRANVLEINPLPGILPDPAAHSCFPLAARTAGLTYAQLINRVVDLAIQRCALEPPSIRPLPTINHRAIHPVRSGAADRAGF